jgi:predicted nucleic acid-binding protein
MKIMIDVNVALDLVQRRISFYDASAAVINKVLRQETLGCFPSHAITTIFYVVSKYAGHEKANEILDWLLAQFDIEAADKKTFLRARTNAIKDFEDAVVASLAETAQCDYIVTRNVADFKGSSIEAITPEEFLVMMET